MLNNPCKRRFLLTVSIFILINSLYSQITDWKLYDSRNLKGKVASCTTHEYNYYAKSGPQLKFIPQGALPHSSIDEEFNKDGYRTNVTRIWRLEFNNTYYGADTERAVIFYDTFNRVVSYYEESVSPGRNRSATTNYIYSGSVIKLTEPSHFYSEELVDRECFDDDWHFHYQHFHRLTFASEKTIQITKINPSTNANINDWDSTIYEFGLINGFGKCVFREKHSSGKFSYPSDDFSCTERYVRTGDSCSNLVLVNGSWIYGNRYNNINNRQGVDIRDFQKKKCNFPWDDTTWLKKRLEQIEIRNAELENCGFVDSLLLKDYELFHEIPIFEYDGCGNWIKLQIFDVKNDELLIQKTRNIKYYTD